MIFCSDFVVFSDCKIDCSKALRNNLHVTVNNRYEMPMKKMPNLVDAAHSCPNKR